MVSRTFLVLVIASLTLFGGVMTALFHAQGEILDRLLPREEECSSIPYQAGERPECVVVQA